MGKVSMTVEAGNMQARVYDGVKQERNIDR